MQLVDFQAEPPGVTDIRSQDEQEVTMSRQSDLDNHANQLNPNNDAYWESRGWDDRPDDWEERAEEDKNSGDDKETNSERVERTSRGR